MATFSDQIESIMKGFMDDFSVPALTASFQTDLRATDFIRQSGASTEKEAQI